MATSATATIKIAHAQGNRQKSPTASSGLEATASLTTVFATTAFSSVFSFDLCSSTENFFGAGEVVRDVFDASTADSSGAMPLRVTKYAANVAITSKTLN